MELNPTQAGVVSPGNWPSAEAQAKALVTIILSAIATTPGDQAVTPEVERVLQTFIQATHDIADARAQARYDAGYDAGRSAATADRLVSIEDVVRRLSFTLTIDHEDLGEVVTVDITPANEAGEFETFAVPDYDPVGLDVAPLNAFDCGEPDCPVCHPSDSALSRLRMA